MYSKHWLFKQHLHKIETCIPNFHDHAVSGMSDGDIYMVDHMVVVPFCGEVI